MCLYFVSNSKIILQNYRNTLHTSTESLFIIGIKKIKADISLGKFNINR